MPLAEALIPIDFGMGIDQSADEKLVQPGRLAALTNARLEKAKRISKRYGYARVGTASNPLQGDVLGVLGSLPFTHEVSSASSGDNIRAQGNAAFQSGQRANLGKRHTECSVTVDVDGRSDADEQYLVDSATIGTLTMYVWEKDTGDCRYMLVDDATGAALIRGGAVSGTANRIPRVIACNGVFLVGVANTTTNAIDVRKFDPAADTTLPTAASSSYTNLDAANRHWDWAAYSTYVCIAYNGAAGTIRLARCSSAGASLTTQSFAASATSSLAVMTPATTASGYFVVVWHNAVAGLQLRYFDPATLAAHFLFGGATHVIDAALTVVENIGVVENASGLGSWNIGVAYQVTAAATYNRVTHVRFLQHGAPPTLAALRTQRSVGLISKPVERFGRLYCVTTHDSTFQKAFFLHAFNISSPLPWPVARAFYGFAGGLTVKPHLSQLNTASSTAYKCAVVRRERIFSDNGAINTLRYCARLTFDFDTLGANRIAQLADTSLMTGGFLGLFDAGASIVESGFLLSPENITAVAAAAGGSLGDGTYQHIVVAEWTDFKGKLHRSAVSVPISSTVSGGGGNGRITLTIPTIRITLKSSGYTSPRSDIAFVIYRTEANKSEIFYRTNTLPSTTFNDVTIDTVTYADNLADATLITRESVYTNGGEASNWTIDGPTAIYAGDERIFCNDPSDDGITWFSKKPITGEAVSFAAENFKRMTSEGGPIRAYAEMDGRLYAFKLRSTWVMGGDGPDATLQFGDFSDFDRVTAADGGCIRQAGCVVTPLGIVVHGEGGFHLLTRDHQWVHIGKAVRDIEQQTVRASIHVPDSKEVRFVMSGGTVLHFKYEFPDEQNLGQWFQSSFSALDAVHAEDGAIYLLESTTRTVYREDSTRFTDEALGGAGADRNIPLSITTHPISLAGVNGLQRIWAIYLLGKFISAHNLTVEISYDNSEVWEPAPFVIDAASATASGHAYRLIVEPRIQQCTSFALRISDDGSGESFNFSTATVKAGVIPGGAKLRAANRSA